MILNDISVEQERRIIFIYYLVATQFKYKVFLFNRNIPKCTVIFKIHGKGCIFSGELPSFYHQPSIKVYIKQGSSNLGRNSRLMT